VAAKGKARGEAGEDGKVVIKKYANRRLYNTASSSYVTLDDLSTMVKDGVDIVVYDAKSGDDITRSVLTQIIFERESRGETLLPAAFLRRLIRFYGDSLQGFVPSYLEASMEAFAKHQDSMREKFTGPWPAGRAMEVFEEQARQNMAMFENAVRMFSPFAAGGAQGGAESAGEANGQAPSGAAKAPAEKKPAKSGESGDRDETIAELRRQMAAMQERLDDIQDGS
jgi:polyhydroxyalkanoate synthesis repressor PhaR